MFFWEGPLPSLLSGKNLGFRPAGAGSIRSSSTSTIFRDSLNIPEMRIRDVSVVFVGIAALVDKEVLLLLGLDDRCGGTNRATKDMGGGLTGRLIVA